MEYKGFNFIIDTRDDGKRYLPLRYSGRATYMDYKGKVLWNNWESSQSGLSTRKTIEEANTFAIKYTKQWIEENISKFKNGKK